MYSLKPEIWVVSEQLRWAGSFDSLDNSPTVPGYDGCSYPVANSPPLSPGPIDVIIPVFNDSRIRGGSLHHISTVFPSEFFRLPCMTLLKCQGFTPLSKTF